MCAEPAIKKNYELVMIAVTQNGNALKFVDHNMLKNKDVIYAAYCNNTRTFEYADISLKNDVEFVRKCYNYDKSVTDFINEVMQDELGIKKERNSSMSKKSLISNDFISNNKQRESQDVRADLDINVLVNKIKSNKKNK